MVSRLALTSAAVLATIGAQTTFTGCHNHTVSSTAILYCYGPDGAESARETYLPATPVSVAATASAASITSRANQTGQSTAITGCHSHDTAIYCINGGGTEVLVAATATSPLPAAYTGCHSHGSETYCLGPGGEEVAVHAEGTTEGVSESGDAHGESGGCHFHAGVE